MPASRLLADGSETLEPGRLILGRLAARQAHRRVGRRHLADASARCARPAGRHRGATPRCSRRCRRRSPRFTAAPFGRDGKLDDAALDEALATSKTVLRRMKFEQLWFMKRLAIRRAGTPLDNRAWSR